MNKAHRTPAAAPKLKRLFLALLFLCLAPLHALAVDLTVSGYSINNWTYGGSTASLRVYASESFLSSDGQLVVGGRPGTASFYKSISCSIAGTTLTIPSFVLPSTTDSTNVPTATYSFIVYDAKGAQRNVLISDAQLPHTLGGTVTIPQIINHNAGRRIYPAPTYPSNDQMNAAIAAALGAGYTSAAFKHTTVAYSATPSFDCGTYSLFDLTLTGNVTSSAAACTATAGRRIVVTVKQDATGGRSFAWPANFTGAPEVERRASAATTAGFYYDGSVWRFESKSTEDEGGYALYCDGNTNVHHGNFFPASVALGNQFYWEAWVRPAPDANGYIVSDGFGGGHALLWGVQCNGTNCGVNGNVWNLNSGSLVSFNSLDAFPADKWTHLAVGGYGQDIRTWINGVPSSVTTFSGLRGSPGGGMGSGNLYVCGSDHSMFKGYIASLRAFEGWIPLQIGGAAFRPATRLTGQLREQTGVGASDVYHAPDAFFDYTAPGATIADMGQGYYGRPHPGVPFNNASGSPAGNTGEEKSMYPRAFWRYDPSLPFNRHGSAPAYPAAVSYTPGGVPSGAEVFDSFNRREQTYAFDSTPTLGSTEGGSLGPQAWNTEGADFGIIGERAVMLTTPTIGRATVNIGGADHSVEATVQSPNVGKNGVVFRAENSNDFLWAGYEFSGAADNVAILRFTGGTLAAIVAIIPTAPTWTSIKAQCVGSSCAVYLNGSATPLHTWTEGVRLTGTRGGIGAYLGSSFARWENFTGYRLPN